MLVCVIAICSALNQLGYWLHSGVTESESELHDGFFMNTRNQLMTEIVLRHIHSCRFPLPPGRQDCVSHALGQ